MLQAEINPEPQYVTTVVGDKVCALSAAYAVMAALFHRERGGGGQEIEVPMFEVMSSFLLVEHIAGAAYDPCYHDACDDLLLVEERVLARPVERRHGGGVRRARHGGGWRRSRWR